MTVAVANRSVLLVDTRTTNGNAFIDCQKYEVIEARGERHIVCGAGDGSDCQLFFEHFRKFGLAVPETPWEDGFEGLILCRKGLYHADAKGSFGLVRSGWTAIGSGGDIAIGAIGLQLGDEKREPTVAELRRGVETAFRYSGDCGGEIDEAWLNPKRWKRK